MRYVWISFVVLAALLIGYFAGSQWPTARALSGTAGADSTVVLPARPVALVVSTRPTPLADSIITLAMRQLGTSYVYAGNTPETGFDCSGFIQYVFGRFQVEVPHSTALLISVGTPVPREQARRGDIVVFTGTAASSTTPGHAGIVVSRPGQPLHFIHSSSARRESGVKISQVEGTDYERRFLQVRRVLL